MAALTPRVTQLGPVLAEGELKAVAELIVAEACAC